MTETVKPKKRNNIKYKVICHNCGEYILDTSTAKLRGEPNLKASMFTLREDREWQIFPPDATNQDLTCPMCSWLFHDNGHVLTKPARAGRRKKTQDRY